MINWLIVGQICQIDWLQWDREHNHPTLNIILWCLHGEQTSLLLLTVFYNIAALDYVSISVLNFAKVWHSLLVTCIHVEGQRLTDIARRKQARPRGSGLQFAHFIVAWQGGEMGWPHCGHEQGPVVRLQRWWWVEFMERPRRPVGLGLGIWPALWWVRVGVRMTVWVRMSVWVRQAWVHPWCIWVHGIGRSTHLTVGAALRGGVVTVPEGRGEASSPAGWRVI